MCPLKIVNACVHNLQIWKQQIEFLIVIKVSLAIAITIDGDKRFCQVLYNALAIVCPCLTTLFFFYDTLSNAPIRGNCCMTRSSVCLPSTNLYNLPNVGNEVIY